MTRHAAWNPKTGQWIAVVDQAHADQLAKQGWLVIGPGYGAHHTIPR